MKANQMYEIEISGQTVDLLIYLLANWRQAYLTDEEANVISEIVKGFEAVRNKDLQAWVYDSRLSDPF